MSKQEISIRFRFEFAHRLLHHKGKCNNIHGHSGIAWINFTGEVDKQTGMMVDFNDIKKTIQAWIDEHWDHTLILNTDDADLLNAFRITPVKIHQTVGDPTMETLSRILHQVVWTMRADEKLPASLMLSRVRIQETENAFVDYVLSEPAVKFDDETELEKFKESIENIDEDGWQRINNMAKDARQKLELAETALQELEKYLAERNSETKIAVEETQSEWLTHAQDEENDSGKSISLTEMDITGIDGRDSQ